MYFSGSTCVPEIFLQKRFLKVHSFGNAATQKTTGSETKVSLWGCISLRYLQHCPGQLDHLPSEKQVSNRRNHGCLWAKAAAEQSHFKVIGRPSRKSLYYSREKIICQDTQLCYQYSLATAGTDKHSFRLAGIIITSPTSTAKWHFRCLYVIHSAASWKTEVPYIPQLLSWDNSDTFTAATREMQLFSPMETTLCCAAPWNTLSHQYASE